MTDEQIDHHEHIRAEEHARRLTEVYGHAPDGVWRAPGRVNLIGEHTDYNGGLALPFAIAAVLAPLGAALARAVIPAALRAAPALEGPLALGWLAFCAFACASGAKALRARQAPAYFFSAFAAAAVAGAALLWAGPEARP